MALSLNDLKRNKVGNTTPSLSDPLVTKKIARPWQDMTNGPVSDPRKPGENPVITRGELGDNPVKTRGQPGETAGTTKLPDLPAEGPKSLLLETGRTLSSLDREAPAASMPFSNEDALIPEPIPSMIQQTEKPGDNPVKTRGQPGDNPVITEGKPGDLVDQTNQRLITSPAHSTLLTPPLSFSPNLPLVDKTPIVFIPNEPNTPLSVTDLAQTILKSSVGLEVSTSQSPSADRQGSQAASKPIHERDTSSKEPGYLGFSTSLTPPISNEVPLNVESNPAKALTRSKSTVSHAAKPGDNRVKTRGKPGDEPGDNRVITRGKPGETYPQRKPEKLETRGKPGDEPGDNPVKTEGKPTDSLRDFRTLVGNDRIVMLAVFRLAQLNGSRTTSFFSRKALCQEFSLRYETLRSCFKRLRTFGIFESITSAGGGPAAWVQVTFPEFTYHSLLLSEAQNLFKPGENRVKTGGKLGDQPGETAPSSSSISYKSITTTPPTEPIIETLSQEWQAIDSSPLKEIHFGTTHISQIAQLGKLKANDLQESIHAFAFDLRKNQKGKDLKTSPLNFFMGILRKGTPYVPPENYESPADESRRKYLEFKRKQNVQREAVEAEIFELEFKDWHSSLDLATKREIAPYAKIDGSGMQLSAHREYFRTQVYSKRSSPESGNS